MKRLISGKFFLTLFLISTCLYIVMISWSIPRLIELSGGLLLFDMSPMGYSFDFANALLTKLGPEGINFYITKQLLLDLFYPMSLILTYFVGCLWIFNKINKWKILGVVGASAALVGGVFDYLENYFVHSILTGFPNITEELVQRASLCTVVKSVGTTITMTIFLIGVVTWLLIALKKK